MTYSNVYKTFATDLSAGQLVEASLSSSMPSFKDGSAVCLTSFADQKLYGDISCSNGAYIDVKCKNSGSPNAVTKNAGVEVLNNFKDGWFIDSRKKTSHYIFANIFTDGRKLSELKSPDDINKMVCMIFSRKELMDVFSAEGYTPDVLREKALKLAEEQQPELYNKESFFVPNPSSPKPDWLGTLTHSYWLPEHPVSLTPRPDIIANLHSTRFFQTSGSTTKLITREEYLSYAKK